MDIRPPLSTVFGPFSVPATVTIPGLSPVVTVWAEQAPFVEAFPADTGRWSLTKSRRCGSLRLDQLPAPTTPGLAWPPPGTEIALAGETFYVDAVDNADGEVAHVLVRSL